MIRITFDKIICCDQGTKTRYVNSPVVDGDYIGFVTEVRPNDYEIICVRQSDIDAQQIPMHEGWKPGLSVPIVKGVFVAEEATAIKDNAFDSNIKYPFTKGWGDNPCKELPPVELDTYHRNINKSFADLYTQRPNSEPKSNWLQEAIMKAKGEQVPGGGYINKWGTLVPNPCQQVDMQGRDMDAIYRNLGPYERLLAVEVRGNHSLWYCNTVDEAIKYANSNPESKYIRYGNVRLVRLEDNTWMNTPISGE